MRFSKLILGSASPRRQELLRSIWFGDLDIVRSDKDEIYPSHLPANEVPIWLSKLKSDDLLESLSSYSELLITADTVVILNGEILGKPKSPEEAIDMLQKLSGKSHTVITGVTLRTIEHSLSFSDQTEVHFHNLSDTDISFYVENYNPLDKAGAYGVQEFIGMIGVKRMNGCFYNVMGLPTSLVYEKMKAI